MDRILDLEVKVSQQNAEIADLLRRVANLERIVTGGGSPPANSWPKMRPKKRAAWTDVTVSGDKMGMH